MSSCFRNAVKKHSPTFPFHINFSCDSITEDPCCNLSSSASTNDANLRWLGFPWGFSTGMMSRHAFLPIMSKPRSPFSSKLQRLSSKAFGSRQHSCWNWWSCREKMDKLHPILGCFSHVGHSGKCQSLVKCCESPWWKTIPERTLICQHSKDVLVSISTHHGL